ncbi:sulfotransferase [Verrucomicrobiaceae bacterium N1E253]|uniref:Sulfotransferase n=1 Tax=Oceaniferula marina TaxID=2748318 RepID=A0A851GNW2_9BACT|nr:sulfotransferase [Oceaniferula marina]NWK56815.1 sulfotransferase [Oceaniferula marina]
MTDLTEKFRKSENLETTLSRINQCITGTELNPATRPQMPLMLIMGCPRSGSTLLMQNLSRLGCFGYPSNLIARFYGNPAFGCEVQKALVDYDKEDQMGIKTQQLEFESQLGRVKGALAPSEFWYYWRRFFHFGEIQKLDDSQLHSVDSDAFLQGLASMESSLGKPLVMKGMLMNWHIDYLLNISERFVFTHIRRDLFSVAQSILESRVHYYGNRKTWWSFKPPEYPELAELGAIEQAAAQAVYTHHAVSMGMQLVPQSRSIEIDYLSLCQSPEAILSTIHQKYQDLGCPLDMPATPVQRFDHREQVRLNNDDEYALRSAIEKYQHQVSA